ncbi:hypothetical protein BGZ82_009692, partial [Podila clonocystis]
MLRAAALARTTPRGVCGLSRNSVATFSPSTKSSLSATTLVSPSVRTLRTAATQSERTFFTRNVLAARPTPLLKTQKAAGVKAVAKGKGYSTEATVAVEEE